MNKGQLPIVPPLKRDQKERQCDRHGKVLLTHCKTCKTLICIQCAQSKHSSHTLDDWQPSKHTEAVLCLIDEAIERGKKYKQDIQSSAQNLEIDIKILLDFIEKRREKIKIEERYVENTVKHLAELKTKLKKGENVEKSIEEVLHIAHESGGEFHESERRIHNLVPKTAEYSAHLLSYSENPPAGKGTTQAQATVPMRSHSIISLQSAWKLQRAFDLERKVYVAALHAHSSNKTWCRQHHHKVLYEMDVEGKVCREVDFGDDSTGDFAILNQKIIYCNFQKKNISLASEPYTENKHFKGKISTDPLIPLGICAVTSGKDSYDIYVGLTDSFDYKASKEGSRSIGYFTLKDNNVSDTRKRYCKSGGKDILSYPYRISHNKVNNGLCVVDQKSRSTGRVVILDRANIGKVINTYDGKDSDKFFDPRDVCCDSKGKIIVSDKSTCDVHILDMSGNFLQKLMDPDSREIPRSVTVTDEFLWIGCENGKIIVLKREK